MIQAMTSIKSLSITKLEGTKEETGTTVSCNLTGKNQITVLESRDLTEELRRRVQKVKYMRNRDLVLGIASKHGGDKRSEVVTYIARNMCWALVLAGGHVDGH